MIRLVLKYAADRHCRSGRRDGEALGHGGQGPTTWSRQPERAVRAAKPGGRVLVFDADASQRWRVGGHTWPRGAFRDANYRDTRAVKGRGAGGRVASASGSHGAESGNRLAGLKADGPPVRCSKGLTV